MVALRILLINPNTSNFVTEIVAEEARHACSAGVEIAAITGTVGAPIVSSRSDNAVAAAQVLKLAGANYHEYDAIVLAVSFDCGLIALRNLMPIPVVGMSEAAMHMACLVGETFGMLTFGDRSSAIYHELVQLYGLATRFNDIYTLPALTDEEMRDTMLVADKVQNVTEQAAASGVEAMVMAGAVFAGMPRQLGSRCPIPMIDGIAAAVRCAETLVSMDIVKAKEEQLS